MDSLDLSLILWLIVTTPAIVLCIPFYGRMTVYRRGLEDAERYLWMENGEHSALGTLRNALEMKYVD